MNVFLGIVVFSVVESATVILWFRAVQTNNVLAAAILVVGYVVEHIMAWNLAKGRPLLSFPPRA